MVSDHVSIAILCRSILHPSSHLFPLEETCFLFFSIFLFSLIIHAPLKRNFITFSVPI
jgi:hypothetical protein